MLIGYMRVSKADGTQARGDLQREALLAAGVDPARLYEDQASGKRDDRLGLEACLKGLRPGDTLVAWKLDRLGRDLRHLVNLAHELTGRGVGLRVLAGEGATIDTTSPNDRCTASSRYWPSSSASCSSSAPGPASPPHVPAAAVVDGRTR